MSTFRKFFILAGLLTATTLLVAGTASAKPTLGTPSITIGAITGASIEVQFTAGNPYGAPAGFSIQWITAEQFANGPDGLAGTLDDNSWPLSDSVDLCKASFSGKAKGYNYMLGPGDTRTVNIGDILFDTPGTSATCVEPLDCGTDYV